MGFILIALAVGIGIGLCQVGIKGLWFIAKKMGGAILSLWQN
jgi:hypothetical protein